MARRKTEPNVAEITEFGRMVIVWNGVEATLRGLVGSLSKDPAFVRILTVHMSTTALCDAVRVWANDHAEEAERDCLLHAVKLFILLRGHRNHYVHGLVGIEGSNDDAYTEAFLMAGEGSVSRETRARSSLQTFAKPLDLSELRAIRRDATALLNFLLSLDAHFLLARIGDDELGAPRPPLPDKPPLPDGIRWEAPGRADRKPPPQRRPSPA